MCEKGHEELQRLSNNYREPVVALVLLTPHDGLECRSAYSPKHRSTNKMKLTLQLVAYTWLKLSTVQDVRNKTDNIFSPARLNA